MDSTHTSTPCWPVMGAGGHDEWLIEMTLITVEMALITDQVRNGETKIDVDAKFNYNCPCDAFNIRRGDGWRPSWVSLIRAKVQR